MRRRRPLAPGPALALVAALGLAAAACAPEPTPEPTPGPPPEPPSGTAVEASPEHREEVETWREERRESLLAEDGWFSLVGLYWLEEGANTFGAGEANDLVFPAGAPERIGTFHRRGDEVRVEAAAGSGLATEGGEAVTETVLAPDTTGEPTVLTLGTLSFHVIARGGRYGVRVKDRESPARAAFAGLDYFPVDAAWRVAARLEPEEGATVAVPNVLGQVEEVRAPGTLVFRAPDGEELRLTPMQEAPGEDLFLVFGDATNGDTTYGGGRFLYAEAPDPDVPDGRVVLDFNLAYNPPCAFTPYATCPLPPAQNKLALAIPAGEKSYAGEIPH